MSVDVLLDAAHVCEYCGAGARLTLDLDGDWVCVEGTGCAAAPATARMGGGVVTLAAIEAAPTETPPSIAAQTDAGLLLGGGDIDAGQLTEKERLAVTAALRIEVARAHERIGRTLRALPHLAGAGRLAEIDAASCAAHAAAQTLTAWERRCNATRTARARKGAKRC